MTIQKQFSKYVEYLFYITDKSFITDSRDLKRIEVQSKSFSKEVLANTIKTTSLFIFFSFSFLSEDDSSSVNPDIGFFFK